MGSRGGNGIKGIGSRSRRWSAAGAARLTLVAARPVPARNGLQCEAHGAGGAGAPLPVSGSDQGEARRPGRRPPQVAPHL